MTGLQLRVGGTCAKCWRERELVMVGDAGICASCIERHIGTSPGPTPLSLDACPTCGMSYACSLCGAGPLPAHAKRWVVHVDLQLPSQNAFKVGAFVPRGANAQQLRRLILGQAARYEQIYDEWLRALRPALMEAAMWKATGPRRVVWTRLMGPRNRPYDTANLAGGSKPVQDALVQLGALVDDDPVNCRPHWLQRRAQPGERAGTRIEIVEL